MTEHDKTPDAPSQQPLAGGESQKFRTVEPEKPAAETNKKLSPVARRALAEAEERRKKMDAKPELPKEVHGRQGPEPTRYGDWEKDGIVSDF